MVKVIVFDFDGVLVNSNWMKYKAWFILFPDHHKQVQEVLSKMYYYTRYEILEYLFAEIKPAEDKNKFIKNYAEKYNFLVRDGVNKLGLANGVRFSLISLYKNYPLYINSGTIEFPLRQCTKELNITHLFKGIYGAPATKSENLQKIIKREKVLPKEVVMIGDGEPDYQAAKQCGTFFLGVANDFNNWLEQEKDYPLVTHTKDIESIIKKF